MPNASELSCAPTAGARLDAAAPELNAQPLHACPSGGSSNSGLYAGGFGRDGTGHFGSEVFGQRHGPTGTSHRAAVQRF